MDIYIFKTRIHLPFISSDVFTTRHLNQLLRIYWDMQIRANNSMKRFKSLQTVSIINCRASRIKNNLIWSYLWIKNGILCYQAVSPKVPICISSSPELTNFSIIIHRIPVYRFYLRVYKQFRNINSVRCLYVSYVNSLLNFG